MPESRIDFLLNAFNVANIAADLYIFVPDTWVMYRETLDKQIHKFQLENKVRVFDDNMPAAVASGSNGYLSTSFGKRKIGNGLIRAYSQDVGLLVTEDSGAEMEMATFSDKVLKSLPNIQAYAEGIRSLQNISRSRHSQFKKLISIKSLAKMMVL